jgi:hypothetical protein
MTNEANCIRVGAPYDEPAFEALCREMSIWGTAQAALCAVFWRRASADLAESIGAGGVSALIVQRQAGQEPVQLQHMAVAENGNLRWMTGRKARDCELYAMPDMGRAPKLYTAPPAASVDVTLTDEGKTPAPEGYRLVPLEPTPAMVDVYLRANTAYWERTDNMPHTNPGKWRNGTPSEATAESYRAMLKAAPQPIALFPNLQKAVREGLADGSIHIT